MGPSVPRGIRARTVARSPVPLSLCPAPLSRCLAPVSLGSAALSLCPAPLSVCPAPRRGQRQPARGRPGHGAAARTCCCPPRRALCRDAGGADVTAGVIINDFFHLFIYLQVYLSAYLIIYLFPFHDAPPGRLRARALPCPPSPRIGTCGGGLGGE